jgi:SAM-dependent methyltransferase
MPWITGAVDIDLLKKIINKSFWSKKLNILEIGCWIWTESVFLSRLWHNITWLDISEEILERAKKLATIYKVNIEFKILNITDEINEKDLKFWSFDLIIDRGCFHHILPSNRNYYLYNVLKLLKKDWYLYIRSFSDKISIPRWEWSTYRISQNILSSIFWEDFLNINIEYYKNISIWECENTDEFWISFIWNKK